jgi:hypothetical protein
MFPMKLMTEEKGGTNVTISTERPLTDTALELPA